MSKDSCFAINKKTSFLFGKEVLYQKSYTSLFNDSILLPLLVKVHFGVYNLVRQ